MAGRGRHAAAIGGSAAPSAAGGASIGGSAVAGGTAELIKLLLDERTSHFDALGLALALHPPADVRSAFRRRSLRVHPDKCAHPQATEAFQALVLAFDTLHESGSQQRALKAASEAERRTKRPRTNGSADGSKPRRRHDGRARERSWADWERDLRRYDELERNFRDAQRSRFVNRRAASSLRQAERVCEELDERAGISDNPLTAEPEPASEGALEATAGAAGSTADPMHLLQLLLYMRRTHLYCLFCGHRFADEEQLQQECPGVLQEEHEADQDELADLDDEW